MNFETTPIHGRSCLVTFMKAAKEHPRGLPVALQDALDQEVAAGLKDGRLMANFKREALGTRTWMHDQLQSLAEQGFKIVACVGNARIPSLYFCNTYPALPSLYCCKTLLRSYGAAAKGMVLLHFLRQLRRSYDFDFVADDAPLKQGTFCPGTSIPVHTTASSFPQCIFVTSTQVLPAKNISTVHPSQPLAIVVMPWNFLEEITFRIQNLVQFPRSAPVILVVPFPRPKLLLLHKSDAPTEVLPPTQPKLPLQAQSHDPHVQVVLLADISGNNAAFIHAFIQHHSSMFDLAIVLDRSETSFVQSAFDAVAPSNWRFTKDSNVVVSSLFEKSFGDRLTFTIRLHGHQLLVHPDFRAFIREFNASSLHFPVVQLSAKTPAKTSASFSNTCLSILCNRTLALSSTITSRTAIKLVTLAASDLAALRAIEYDPCIAVLVVLGADAALPEPGAVRPDGGVVEWMADNRAKGVSAVDAVTIHTTPTFSRDHWDAPDATVVALVLEAAGLTKAGAAEPAEVQVHRWMFAKPTRLHPAPFLMAAGLPPLVFAGDAFDGAKVEGAVLSGRRAGEALRHALGD